jgi:hypothetical protein
MNATASSTRAVSILFLVAAMLASACGSSSDDDAKDKDAGSGGGGDEQLAATCDWLEHRLSIVDLGKLKKGAKRADALVGEIDLSDYPAGPLEMTIVPGTDLAIVSLSAGFFSLSSFAGVIVDAKSIPTDSGKLLFVDLKARKVVGELVVGKHPMSVAVSSDGKRGFVTNFGTPEVTEFDIEKRSVIDSVNVGIYSEAIMLDDTGEVGIFSYSATGNVRTFGASDFAGTLSAPIELAGDSAGVAFFPGTKIAYVVHSAMPITSAKGGHALIDVTDPKDPKTLENVRSDDAGYMYPVLAIPERDSVVVPSTQSGTFVVEEITLDDKGATQVAQSFDIGKASYLGAYGMALGTDGRVWLAAPAARGLIAVDLDAKSSYPVAWGSPDASPTCIAMLHEVD